MTRATGDVTQRTRARSTLVWIASVVVFMIAPLVALPVAAQGSAAQIVGSEQSLPLWSAVRVLRDVERNKTIDDVRRTP
ncbi:MAG TPA: hypothetical protein PLK42_10350, partial [Casimicrobium sp.]|nr:hypothetical protein [Casimicrobium sp.]